MCVTCILPHGESILILFPSLQRIHRLCACNTPICRDIKPQHAPEDKNGINIFDEPRNTVNFLSLLKLDPG